VVQFNDGQSALVGQAGSLAVRSDDEVTRKLAMLIEGECDGLGPVAAAHKHGYSRQRYFQLRKLFLEQGAVGLISRKRGPKTNYRRTSEIVRQIIRYRFLDPQSSVEVIAQKLRQLGTVISTRSVERVIADYGLQKKTPHASTKRRRRRR
jgi:hypothetical protein